jgi:hypothetical protein
MRDRVKRLLIVLVLLIFTMVLYRFALSKPVLEEPKKLLPVDSQLKSYFGKEPDIKEAVNLVQKYYWNAWISEGAIKNGGWKNILSLCTEDFSKKIRSDSGLQDAISLGSIHDKVKRVYLDTSRSKIIGFARDKKDKNLGVVLVDLWLGIDQLRLGDYFLHQQAEIMLRKIDGKWYIENILIIAAEEKPSSVIPE